MANKSRQFYAFIIIVVVVGFIIAVKSTHRPEARMVEEVDSKVARFKGPENAAIKITEYIDFQCPACAKGAIYLKNFMQTKPGILSLNMKYFPLRGHKFGLPAARYAQCAAKQNKFWEFHDRVLETQSDWKKLNDAIPAFEHIAKEIQLNEKQLKRCLSDNSLNNIIAQDKEEGQALGVKSTPTYFINGKMFVGTKSLGLEINRLLKSN